MRAFLNRPDHLTRAAMELSQLRDVQADARALPLSSKILITTVSVGAQGQPALFVTQQDAMKVTRRSSRRSRAYGRSKCDDEVT